MVVRRVGRLLLAAVFVWGGVDTLRNPAPRVQLAAPFLHRVIARVGDRLPEQVPTDPETLVKFDATVKVLAGLGLAFGRFPRLSALALAASMVPTTLAGHSYWEHTDPAARAAQRSHFFNNASLIGGLLVAATEPKAKRRQD